MKKFFKKCGKGIIIMIGGVAAMLGLLSAVENIQSISQSNGWVAIFHFFIAIVCIGCFLIIIRILGESTKVIEKENKKKVYSK